MDTSRRVLLKGLAAAPLVASAGGLFVPRTAYAATASAVVRMQLGMSGARRWADASDALRATWQAATVDDVLTTARWRGTDVGDWDDGAGSVPEPHGFRYGFGWDPDTMAPDNTWDRRSNWYPQGVTSTYDGYGGPLAGRDILAVSWYAKGQDFDARGARVSFIDVTGDGARPRYQHVLLVEPLQASASSRPTFRPVSIHAGGMAWIGNFLYIANRPGETTHVRRGGMSVFDVSKLVKVTGRGKARAYGHDYVLPLHHTYENAGGTTLQHSQLSLDRTQSRGPSLVVSEYRTDRSGVAARWRVAQSGYIVDGTSEAPWGLGVARVQGAVSVGDDAYYSANSRQTGGKRRGELWKHPDHRGRATVLGQLSKGPEDLSYVPLEGGSLWAVGEHAGLRRVYRCRI